LSALSIILVSLTMILFSEKVLISNRCISGLMPNLIKKSWTDSNVAYQAIICMKVLKYYYYKCWSYKCYNRNFLDRTVRINDFSFIFSRNSIFHVLKKILRDKTSMYIGKLKKILQTVRIIGPVCIIGT
jgi:hypothetical protein